MGAGTERWLYGWGVGYVAVGAASLLVPLYAIGRGAGVVIVGLVAATAAFAGASGALVWGWFAARTRRRRPFLLVTLGATAGILAALPLAASLAAIVALNAALWFAVAAAAPAANLVVVDGRDESEWPARTARLDAVQGYGWIAGLLLGTAWTAAGARATDALTAQRALFPVIAGVAVLGFLVVLRWYPDRPSVSPGRFVRSFRRPDRRRTGAGRYIRWVPYGPSRLYWAVVAFRPDRFRAALRRPLSAYLAGATCFSAGFAVFWGPMPAFLAGRGYSAELVFGLFLLANLGSAAAYAPMLPLVTRHGPLRVQNGALAARVALLPLVGALGGLALGLPALALCFGLVGITWAAVAVTTADLASRLVPAAGRPEATGALTALAALGTGVGSLAGGVVAASVGYLVAFTVAGLLVLLGGTVAAAAFVRGGATGTATGA